MKTLLAVVISLAAVGSASAQPRVGVSLGINEPGVYGRINLGDLPREALVAPQPVLIAPPRVAIDRRPTYLYVSPFEQQNWGRYCNRYAACGQPVYFVRDGWVRERYVHDHPGWDRDHHDHRGRPGSRDERRFEDHGHDDGRRHDRRD